ncbi:MAG: hypothetical protein WC652_00230 [archaeon]
MLFFIASLILASLILFGCDEQMTTAEKNICFSMSSRSYAYVPTCVTVNSCFEKVNPLFNQSLGYSQDSTIYEIKNHVARSWYFYNLTLAEMKKVSNYCTSGNYVALAGGINQAKFYLDTSFLELDEGVKKSFSVISAEENYLSNQKVDLIKEEAIYDSEVELQQIISELNSGPTNSDSYVSYYLNKIEAFNKSTLAKTSVVLAEKTPFWIENYENFQGTILKQLGVANQAHFVFLNEALRKGIDYAEMKFYTKQSLTALQNLPVFEFMSLYSNLGGNSNSSIKRFADLINRTGKNLQNTSKTIEEVWDKIEIERKNCESLLEKSKEFEKYSSLVNELSSTSVTTENSPQVAFQKTTQEYILIKDKKNKGNLTIGEELSSIKAILNNSLVIKKQLEWINEKLISELSNACDNKAKEIKKEALSSEKDSIKLLIEETLFYASKTLSTTNEEKLNYCYNLVEKSKTLNEAFSNYSLLESKKKDLAKDCINYLESVLPKTDLSELTLLFSNLKNQSVNSNNLLEFEEDCQSIKEQVENELNSDKDILQITQETEELKKTLLILKEINNYSPSPALEKEISLFEEKIENYNNYFANGKVNLSEVLPIKKILLDSISDNLKIFSSTLQDKIIQYAKENYSIILFNLKVPQTNEDINTNAKLTIPNPFQSINTTFYLDLPFSIALLNSKDSCITQIIQVDKNTTRFLLNCLPFGNTTSDFIISQKITQKELDEFLYVSNKTSLLKREIQLNSTGEFTKLLIKTTPPFAPSKCTAIINETEKVCYLDEAGKANFLAENVSEKIQITVFFYIEGLISIDLQESTQNSAEQNSIEYKLTAKNNSNSQVSAEISLPVPINSSIESIFLVDEEFNESKINLSGFNIIIKNKKFEAKQERYFTLTIKVNSLHEYYFQTLLEQKDLLTLLGNTELARKTQEVINLGENANLAEVKSIISNNSLAIASLQKVREKENALELMKATLLSKIEELRKNQSELVSLGLLTQAKEIENLINKTLSLDLSNENTLAKAFDQISKASFTIEKQIVDESNSLSDKLSVLLKENNNSNITTLQNDFLNSKDIILKEISSNPVLAKNEFTKLQNTYSQIISLKAQIDKNSQAESKTQTKTIESLAQEALTLISLLDNQLFSDEEQILKAKIVPPITQSRLKKLSLMISEIKTSISSNNEKIAALTDIRDELKKAYDYLKRQAIVSFNGAIESNVSKETLLKAKELIDSNSYTGALFLLSASSPQTPPFSQFSVLFPIVLIVLVAFVLKSTLGKKEKEIDTKKQLILEEWKE